MRFSVARARGQAYAGVMRRPSLFSLAGRAFRDPVNGIWCMRVSFSAGRKVQPPTTDLLAHWIDGWGRRLGGGRRRTSSALAIPAGVALGFVQLFLHRVGRLERGIQAHRSGRSRASMGRAQEQAQHELRQAVARAKVIRYDGT